MCTLNTDTCFGQLVLYAWPHTCQVIIQYVDTICNMTTNAKNSAYWPTMRNEQRKQISRFNKHTQCVLYFAKKQNYFSNQFISKKTNFAPAIWIRDKLQNLISAIFNSKASWPTNGILWLGQPWPHFAKAKQAIYVVNPSESIIGRPDLEIAI